VKACQLRETAEVLNVPPGVVGKGVLDLELAQVLGCWLLQQRAQVCGVANWLLKPMQSMYAGQLQ